MAYMKKILFFTVLLISFQTILNAQLNDYKYIVVPIKFQDLNHPNQFQTSTLIKYHMSQKGFNVIYDNAVPEDLQQNRCLALYTDLIDTSTMFRTKISIALKDCKGEVKFKTIEVQTKNKDLDEGYKEVIALASDYFEGMTHNYTPQNTSSNKVVKTTDLSKNKDNATGVDSSDIYVAPTLNKRAINGTVREKETLYAKPVENGFQLLDENNAVRYQLENTSVENVFMVNQENLNGVVLKKENKWFLEYKDAKEKVIQELQIIF